MAAAARSVATLRRCRSARRAAIAAVVLCLAVSRGATAVLARQPSDRSMKYGENVGIPNAFLGSRQLNTTLMASFAQTWANGLNASVKNSADPLQAVIAEAPWLML